MCVCVCVVGMVWGEDVRGQVRHFNIIGSQLILSLSFLLIHLFLC